MSLPGELQFVGRRHGFVQRQRALQIICCGLGVAPSTGFAEVAERACGSCRVYSFAAFIGRYELEPLVYLNHSHLHTVAHTTFDLHRGAGDLTKLREVRVQIAYGLVKDDLRLHKTGTSRRLG